LRTGSAGDRSAEDLVKTLPEPKRTVVSSIREKLLRLGYQESPEYDAINVEPVLIYSKSEKNSMFLKFKWELYCAIPVLDIQKFETSGLNLTSSKFLTEDYEGRHWLKFRLPEEETLALETLQMVI
jgi:hypothetical protein